MRLLAMLLALAGSAQSLPPNFILLMSDVSERRLHLTRSGGHLLLLLLLLLLLHLHVLHLPATLDQRPVWCPGHGVG